MPSGAEQDTGPPSPAAPSGERPPLLEISNQIVALHKRFFGKGPESARVIYREDTIVVLLRGVLTRIEQTLVDEGREDHVIQQRHDLQKAMQDRYIDLVQSITGRQVEAFLSASNHEPDVQAKIFLLHPAD